MVRFRTPMETQPILSRLKSDVEPRPPHDSLVAAFESAARDRAPFVTLHGARGPVVRPIRDALVSAWRWRAALRARGVARGDRVPLLMPTGHAVGEAMLGTMLLGAIPVPLATPMTFGNVDRYLRNLAAVIDDCGARVLVTYARFSDAIAADAGLSASLRDVLRRFHRRRSRHVHGRTVFPASDATRLARASHRLPARLSGSRNRQRFE